MRLYIALFTCIALVVIGPSLSLSPPPKPPSAAVTSSPAVSHYDLLSLPPTATQPEIKSRFLSLVKTLHPDGAGANPKEVAMPSYDAVVDAYKTLKDPARKKRYDRASAPTQCT